MTISRRRFLRLPATAALAASAPSLLAAKPKVGVALLGLGHYSRTQLAPALQLTQHCELRGLITGTPSKLPDWQSRYRIKDQNAYVYEDMDKIANNPDIDVVYVVTPTSTHKDFAIRAANAGKHVWCEKPMAMTVAECEAMIAACRKNKVKLSIGYRMQHEPNTQTVMGYATSKPFGPIKSLIAKAGYFGTPRDPENWRLKRDMGGGALYDMGVYVINGARYATAMEPVRVKARHILNRPKLFKEVDETTELELEFADGTIAQCATSVGENYNVLRVNCAKGWYELAPMQSYNGVVGVRSDGTELDTFIANQQAAQMDNDALAIQKGLPVRVPGEDGLRDIHIVEAAFASARDGKWKTL